MLRTLVRFVLLLLVVIPALSQNAKPRLFISNTASWTTTGGWTANGESGSAQISGGNQKNIAEAIRLFNERCPEVTVTTNRVKADYVVLLDFPEPGRTNLHKVVVSNREDDVIFSHSTYRLRSSVKDACSAIVKNWAEKKAK